MVSSPTSTWSLPPYLGPHDVGTRLEEVSLPSHDRIDIPYCPRTRTLKFRIYYPIDHASAQDAQHPRWASPDQIRGFADFAGIKALSTLLNPTLSYLLSHIRLPAASNVPILQSEDDCAIFPIVLFSHGLGGTDTSYSTICGNLASYGMVVFALEHRDHSASSTVICETGREAEQVEYISPVDQSNPQLKIRAQYMLNQRNLELRLLLRHIKYMNAQSPEFRGRLDLDNISLVGHSFGAATCLHLLDSQSKSKYLRVLDLYGHRIDTSSVPLEATFKAAVLLDIWTQPLAEPLLLDGVPILNLVSAEFSRWPSNHDRLLALVEASKSADAEAAVYDDEKLGGGDAERTVLERHQMECHIIKESLHLSQSDGGLLYPTFIRLVSGHKRPAFAIMQENVERTIDFFLRHSTLTQQTRTNTSTKDRRVEEHENHEIPPEPSWLSRWRPWNAGVTI